MRNTFRLYDDKRGWEAATVRIKRAADALAKELEKHRRFGATDTHSMEAACDYVWQKVRQS